MTLKLWGDSKDINNTVIVVVQEGEYTLVRVDFYFRNSIGWVLEGRFILTQVCGAVLQRASSPLVGLLFVYSFQFPAQDETIMYGKCRFQLQYPHDKS